MRQTNKQSTNEMNMHKNICDTIHDLFVSKRADYGNTTEELLKKYGPISMLTFLSTKLSRLENLMLRQGTPKNESIDDTLFDLANYAIIWILEREKAKDCETKSKGML